MPGLALARGARYPGDPRAHFRLQTLSATDVSVSGWWISQDSARGGDVIGSCALRETRFA